MQLRMWQAQFTAASQCETGVGGSGGRRAGMLGAGHGLAKGQLPCRGALWPGAGAEAVGSWVGAQRRRVQGRRGGGEGFGGPRCRACVSQQALLAEQPGTARLRPCYCTCVENRTAVTAWPRHHSVRHLRKKLIRKKCCLAQAPYMPAARAGSNAQVPIVIRGPGGVGRQLGAEHSQRLESYFQSIPGVQLVACSTVSNAKALLKAVSRGRWWWWCGLGGTCIPALGWWWQGSWVVACSWWPSVAFPVPRLCSWRLAVRRVGSVGCGCVCGLVPGRARGRSRGSGRGREVYAVKQLVASLTVGTSYRAGMQGGVRLVATGWRKGPAYRGARSDGVRSTIARGKGLVYLRGP